MGGAGATTLRTFGTGAGEFSTLEGIFVDRAGRIYVTDFNKIVRINDMTGTGWTVLRGAGDNKFNRPSGIFVDGADRIYVTDRDSGSIVRVNDMTGAGWTTLGSRGSGVNQFNGVAMQSTPYTYDLTMAGRAGGIFVDGAGRIYVADSNRVVRMNDMTGAGWTALDTPGTAVAIFVR